MRKTVGLALLLGILALSPGCASTPEETHPIEQADTPAEHAALAKHYRAEAAEARANAARHQSMAKAYDKRFKGSNEKLTWAMQGGRHCQKLSEASTAMANEYEALATLHDEEAK
jgi:hypothetical protein